MAKFLLLLEGRRTAQPSASDEQMQAALDLAVAGPGHGPLLDQLGDHWPACQSARCSCPLLSG